MYLNLFVLRKQDADLNGSVQTDITIWDWLFNSSSSILTRHPTSALGGYNNGITRERIDYAQLREYTTYLSTALVKKYGLKEGQIVALFSPNTIYHPVAVVSAVREGVQCSRIG